MKTHLKYFFPVILVLVLVLSLPAQALAVSNTKVIVGGTYTLEEGETLDENLTVVGGAVLLESGSTVNGTVYILGGTLDVEGTINGDIVATGGYIHLGEDAIVNGDVTSAGGYVDQTAEAVVTGELQSELDESFPLVLPGASRMPNLDRPFSLFWDGLWFLAQILILSALAVLLAMFLPKQMDRIQSQLVTQPFIAGGLGLLTAVIAPLVVLFLVITVCLIPAALLGVLLLGVLVLFGWVACGMEVGERLAVLLKQDWSAPICAGAGTFLLTLVIGGAGKLWCVGWIFPTLVSLVGLGAVLLTLFEGWNTSSSGQRAVLTPAAAETQTAPAEDEGPAEGI